MFSGVTNSSYPWAINGIVVFAQLRFDGFFISGLPDAAVISTPVKVSKRK